MPRLKQARSKMKPVSLRMKSVAISDASPGLVERKRFYYSRAWKVLRKSQLDSMPTCRICGAWATVADHIYSHDDEQAAAAATRLGQSIPPTWQQRLAWPPGLQSLCGRCHRDKSTAEARGKLVDWLRKQSNAT